MKLFTNKNLIQKIIIAICCITLLNFCMAPRVQAATFGGTMMKYIREFATALGDVAISLMQLGLTGRWTYAVDEKGTGEVQDINGKRSDYWIKDSKFQYPIIQLSPELIFGDKVELLGIDFIGGDNGEEGDNKYILKTDGSAIEKLRVIIASWYVTLRTIAIVGLLSVLIYIGIRIIISSTSQDRAKYKQRLVDWIVAFCLLFFMHYIMAAAVNVVGQVNDILGKNIINGIKLSPEFGNVKYDNESTTDNDNYTMGETQILLGAWPDVVNTGYSDVRRYIESDSVYCVKHGTEILTLSEAISKGYIKCNRTNWSATSEEESTGIYKVTYSSTSKNSNGDEAGLELTFTMVGESENRKIFVADVAFRTANPGGTGTEFHDNIKQENGIAKTLAEFKSLYAKGIADKGFQFNTPDNNETGTITAPDHGPISGIIIDILEDIAASVTPANAAGKTEHNVIVSKTAVDTNSQEGDGSEILYYINYARLYLNVSAKEKYVAISVGYLILYLVLVVFTGMFTIRYMKRVIYVAFLTLIAPMVAMTYPLDKIKDRKSTSFQYVV